MERIEKRKILNFDFEHDLIPEYLLRYTSTKKRRAKKIQEHEEIEKASLQTLFSEVAA